MEPLKPVDALVRGFPWRLAKHSVMVVHTFLVEKINNQTRQADNPLGLGAGFIAKNTHYNRRTVQRALKALELSGLARRVHRTAPNNANLPNQIELFSDLPNDTPPHPSLLRKPRTGRPIAATAHRTTPAKSFAAAPSAPPAESWDVVWEAIVRIRAELMEKLHGRATDPRSPGRDDRRWIVHELRNTAAEFAKLPAAADKGDPLQYVIRWTLKQWLQNDGRNGKTYLKDTTWALTGLRDDLRPLTVAFAKKFPKAPSAAQQGQARAGPAPPVRASWAMAASKIRCQHQSGGVSCGQGNTEVFVVSRGDIRHLCPEHLALQRRAAS